MILLQLVLRLSLDACARILGPFYGQFTAKSSMFSTIYVLIFSSVLVGGLLFKRKARPMEIYLLSALLVAATPLYAFTTRDLALVWGPEKGPILSSLPLVAAVCLLTAASAVDAFSSVTTVAFFIGMQRVDIPAEIARLSSCTLMTLSSLLVCGMAYCFRRKGSSFLLLLVVAACAIGVPLLSRSVGVIQCTKSTNTVRQVDPDHSVLARAESVTGFVSVVQVKTEYGPVKVMKCDHTVLGGVYLDYDEQSIFKTFYFMDFVRFIRRPSAQTFDITAQTVLQVGLGIGASAKTLMDSGATMDVVELDPVLYRYAIDYFHLPAPRSAHLVDGRLFLENTTDSGVYDYILHDVFSGGVVPAPLFSIEAFQRCKTLLKPDGVLAVNFVGSRASMATLSVLKTLQSVFSTVSAYEEDPAADDSQVMNLVFYATANSEIVFDFDQDTTYPAASSVYASTLNELKKAQPWVPFGSKEHWNDTPVITDQVNPLMDLQKPSALEHFYLVQSVFSSPLFWTDLF
ncbi:hypothetical protein HDV03_004443 [Kappamyces sp. JEL0829]|nr:hypothetical protein HDV03_004443 [Kappamyces sp. JEL0829]